MKGDQAASFLYLLLLLMLVVSAFAVRRVPITKSLKMFAIWALIFFAMFMVFVLKDDFRDLGRRIVAERGGRPVMMSEGRTLRIRRAADGHYWVNARLNGEEFRFLIDSGATVTSISSNAARSAGVEVSGGFPVIVETANGRIFVKRGRVARLEVGSIERDDVAVHVGDGFGGTNVLGMNFLSSLSGWAVEDGWLILKA